MPDTAKQDRIYSVLEARGVDPKAGLPPYGELDESVSAIGGVEEFLIAPIAEAVIRVANAGEPHSFSHEDVARLVFWADHVRERAEEIIDEAAKVAYIAHFVFPQVDGFSGDVTGFDDNGNPDDRAEWVAWKRKNGFGGSDGR